jgi:hypothetical protein
MLSYTLMGIIIIFFGWMLKRLWTQNGLLKWNHCVCHRKKLKNVESKVMSKLNLKNKASSNEEFISEMHWSFPNIYIFNF